MVVASKSLFYEKIGDQMQCDVVHFWGRDCVHGNAFVASYAFLGTLKFFLPIYIIKAIINHKKLRDKKFLKSLVIEEIRSGVYGAIMANLIIGSICTLCKFNGRINYYSLALIPGIVSGLSVLVETKENRTLDTLIFFNLLMDAMFRNMDYFNILKLTRLKETVLFMLVSSLLMHVLQNRKNNIRYTNFWFFTPPKFMNESCEKTKKGLGKSCDHKESCTIYSLNGTRKYFVLGYAFSIMRKLIPKMLIAIKQPRELLKILINKDNIKFGMFIGAYVGLYRYIMCFLLNTQTIHKRYYGAMAGLISGATYAISPNLQVLTVGITTICQIFYQKLLKNLQIKNKCIPELIVYLLSNGLLMHNAVMCKRTCPSYYTNMLDTCTNNMYTDIYTAVILKYF